METWQIVATLLISIGAFLTPIVLAAAARDRSLHAAISGAKEDMGQKIADATNPLHDRVNRVRDEYVRRDDLAGHLSRIEKSIDDTKAETRRQYESIDKRLSEIARSVSK